MPRFVAELAELVRMPTISSDPARGAQLRRCAGWLAQHLRGIGIEAAVVPTERHPLVWGRWRGAPGRPTLLVYGHYDVQPVEPLSAWHSPPFEPVVSAGSMLGRGASDDKGQFFAHLKALESHLRSGSPPVNAVVLVEGEEEIGSPHLERFLREQAPELRADIAVVSDMPMRGPGRPAITYALRGALSLDLEVTGPQHDLHSGVFGGAVHNPLQALCEIVAGLHDGRHRIAVPGFYDRVREPSPDERAEMRRSGPSDAEILAEAASDRGWAEPGLTLYEQTTCRPALAVTGIAGGHQGPGSKSIVPARALAKLNLRLVPDQEPAEIEALLRRHIAQMTPHTVRSRLVASAAARPVLVDRGHGGIRAAAVACARGFGAPPVFLRSGGTIPIVDAFQRVLGVPTVLMGFGLPGDGMHAPNERMHLGTFARAVATSIWFQSELAAG
jgi:acetylornithine deacetylase/succinyl-diaminopimelate desuccinylase-like protein